MPPAVRRRQRRGGPRPKSELPSPQRGRGSGSWASPRFRRPHGGSARAASPRLPGQNPAPGPIRSNPQFGARAFPPYAIAAVSSALARPPSVPDRAPAANGGGVPRAPPDPLSEKGKSPRPPQREDGCAVDQEPPRKPRAVQRPSPRTLARHNLERATVNSPPRRRFASWPATLRSWPDAAGARLRRALPGSRRSGPLHVPAASRGID